MALPGSALASSVLLTACTGMLSQKASDGPGANPIDSQADPVIETSSSELDYLPILEAVPLVACLEKGL